jgi:hypothetical protein
VSADDVLDKPLKYVFSKDHDSQDFRKTPQAKQVASKLRICKGASKGPGEILDAGLHPVCGHQVCAGSRGRDSRFNFVVVQKRCFAPEEGWTRHPQLGNCGAPKRALMFTQVNFRCVNKFVHSPNEHGSER